MLSPNTLLQDRYLIMRLLGQGGMGAVYQATDRKFGSAVAVKETFYNNDQYRQLAEQHQLIAAVLELGGQRPGDFKAVG